MNAPRWPSLERRFGLIHPYERTAAEIASLRRNPDARPTGVSSRRQRGLPLWPLAVVLALGWTALLILLP